MAKKKRQEKEQKYAKELLERMDVKREVLHETLDVLTDFCQDNILALEPLADEEVFDGAEKVQDRMLKYETIVQILQTLKKITTKNKD